MTEALLKAGNHIITAITRVESQNKFPASVVPKKVDYNKPETLIEALRGQDVLVITLSGRTPKETDIQLINAAGEAGVAWIIPSEWGPDTANEVLVSDLIAFQPKGEQSHCICTINETLADQELLYLQWPLAMPSQILVRVLTSLYVPASGTSGVWLCPRALGLTLPTALSLFSTRVRLRSLRQLCHRYANILQPLL